MDRERVGDPVQPPERVLGRVLVGQRLGAQGDGQDDDLLAAQPQAGQRVPGTRAALEGGADQVRAKAALHVGSGAHAQHVQGDELGGILQGGGSFGRDLPVHRGPDRAEHLVARADSDRDSLLADGVGAEHGRVDDHWPVLAVELAEDAELGEHPGVPLRDLAADDRLHARRVGLVLAAGEREHARAAVLDGHGRIEEGPHRVRHGEQVTRRETSERLRFGGADVALGEKRAQQRGQLCPGRAPTQAEERDAGLLAPPRRASVVDGHGRADDESDRAATSQVSHEAGEVGGRHPDTEDQRTGWVAPVRHRGRG